MTSEKYNLGLIPIFYLFLLGSSGRELEFTDGQFSDKDENTQKASLAENGWMNRSSQEEKKSSICN